MYYWKASSDDGAYEEVSPSKYHTKKEAYEQMRAAALHKACWNTQYDEDFDDESMKIEYQFVFSQDKIIHKSYSGTYTYEIVEEPDKHVMQFGIDILTIETVTEEEIVKALDKSGITVVGVCWHATWTEDDYEHGRPPIASD